MLDELGAVMILGKDTSHDIVLTRESRDRQTRGTGTCQNLTFGTNRQNEVVLGIISEDHHGSQNF